MGEKEKAEETLEWKPITNVDQAVKLRELRNNKK